MAAPIPCGHLYRDGSRCAIEEHGRALARLTCSVAFCLSSARMSSRTYSLTLLAIVCGAIAIGGSELDQGMNDAASCQ